MKVVLSRRRPALVLLLLLIGGIASAAPAPAAGPATCPFYLVPKGALSSFVWRDGTTVDLPTASFSPTLARQATTDSSGIVLADFDGTNKVTAVPKPNAFASVAAGPWSPDGARVLGSVTRPGVSVTLEIIDAASATATSVPGWAPMHTPDFHQPDPIDIWSPDAHRVIVEDGVNVGILDLSGASPVVVVIESEATAFTQVIGWSADGGWVAMAQQPGGAGPWNLELVRRDGAVHVPVASGISVPLGVSTPWSWRPGTEQFSVLQGSSLLTVDATGPTSSTQSLPGTLPLAGPSYSVDGSRLAWSDATQVWRRDLTTLATSSVTPFALVVPDPSPTTLGAPAWSPDGSLLGVGRSRGGPGQTLDLAITDAGSVLRTDLGVTAYASFRSISPWAGRWSADGTVFRASAMQDGSTYVSALAPLVTIDPVTSLTRRAWWQTCTASGAGAPVWARSAGGSGSDLARNVRVDAKGNTYVVGTITGSVTFGAGAGAVNLVTEGPKDGFLAKYLPDGSLSWVKRIGGTASDEAWGLALDPSGNPVVTGVFDGTVAFNVLNVLNGTNDMFVAKYTSAGALSWVRAGTGPDWEQGLSVSVDSNGYVFVGGVYASASATFGTGSGQSLTNQGSLDGFVARYGPGGGLWWVSSMAGPGQDFLTGVAARPDGSVAVTGTINQPARFGVGGSMLPIVGGNDAFVGLFGAGGAPVWSTNVAGPGSDIGWSIATDAAGDLYVAGAFSGTAAAGAFNATSAGSMDGFVARFNGAGSALWMRRAGGSGADFALGVAVSGSDLYLTGSLMGAGTFGPQTVGAGSGATPADGFVARLGADGAWVWAEPLVSGPGTDYGLAISATPAGVYATGNFVGPSATIGQGSGALTVTGAGSDDLFVTRLNP
jgi:hypothetical protein